MGKLTITINGYERALDERYEVSVYGIICDASALHEAILLKDNKILKDVLEKYILFSKENPETSLFSNFLYTPFHLAVITRNTESINIIMDQMLINEENRPYFLQPVAGWLEHSAPSPDRDDMAETPRQLAKRLERTDIAKLLYKTESYIKYAKRTELIFASRRGQEDKVIGILTEIAWQEPNFSEQFLLKAAVSMKSAELLQFLEKEGSVSFVDKYGVLHREAMTLALTNLKNTALPNNGSPELDSVSILLNNGAQWIQETIKSHASSEILFLHEHLPLFTRSLNGLFSFAMNSVLKAEASANLSMKKESKEAIERRFLQCAFVMSSLNLCNIKKITDIQEVDLDAFSAALKQLPHLTADELLGKKRTTALTALFEAIQQSLEEASPTVTLQKRDVIQLKKQPESKATRDNVLALVEQLHLLNQCVEQDNAATVIEMIHNYTLSFTEHGLELPESVLDRTPLHTAVISGNTNLLQVLLSKCVYDINARKPFLLQENSTGIAKSWLHFRDKETGERPIEAAVRRTDKTQVMDLLTAHAVELGRPHDLLFAAVSLENCSVLEFLEESKCIAPFNNQRNVSVDTLSTALFSAQTRKSNHYFQSTPSNFAAKNEAKGILSLLLNYSGNLICSEIKKTLVNRENELALNVLDKFLFLPGLISNEPLSPTPQDMDKLGLSHGLFNLAMRTVLTHVASTKKNGSFYQMKHYVCTAIVMEAFKECGVRENAKLEEKASHIEACSKTIKNLLKHNPKELIDIYQEASQGKAKEKFYEAFKEAYDKAEKKAKSQDSSSPASHAKLPHLFSASSSNASLFK